MTLAAATAAVKSALNTDTYLCQGDIRKGSRLLEELSCDGGISNQEVLEDSAVWCICHVC